MPRYFVALTTTLLCATPVLAAHPNCLLNSTVVIALNNDYNNSSSARHSLLSNFVTGQSSYRTATPGPSFSYSPDYGGLAVGLISAYVITNDSTYLSDAIAWSKWIDASGPWTDSNGRGGTIPYDSTYDSNLDGISLTYDWGYNAMSSGDRTALYNILVSRGRAFYNNGVTGATPEYWVPEYMQNHNWQGFQALAMTACALQPEDNADASTWLASAKADFTQVSDRLNLTSDGLWHEGQAYENSSLIEILKGWLALKSAGQGDLTSTSFMSGFVNMRAALYMPELTREVPLMNGDFYNWERQSPAILRYAASLAGIPASTAQNAQWLANSWRSGRGHSYNNGSVSITAAGDYYTNAPEDFELMLEAIVWPTSVQPVAPILGDAFLSTQQAAVLRATGTSSNTMLVTLKAGAFGGLTYWHHLCDAPAPRTTTTELNFGHDHADDMGLYITYGNDHLLPEGNGYDIGHPNTSDPTKPYDGATVPPADETRYHNSLLIDNVDQTGKCATCSIAGDYGLNMTLFESGSSDPFPWYCTRASSIPHVGGTTSYGYEMGQGVDPRNGYNLYPVSDLTRFDRHVFQSRSGGGRYAIVRDVLEATGSHAYSTTWHFEDAVSVSGSWIQGTAALNAQSQKNQLGIYVAAPNVGPTAPTPMQAENQDHFVGESKLPYAEVTSSGSSGNVNFLQVLVPVPAVGSWSALPTISPVNTSDPDGTLKVQGGFNGGASDTEEWIFNRLPGDSRTSGVLAVTGQAGVVALSNSLVVRSAVFDGSSITYNGVTYLATQGGTADAAEARWNGTTVYVEFSPLQASPPTGFVVYAQGATQAFLNGTAVPATLSNGFLEYPQVTPYFALAASQNNVAVGAGGSATVAVSASSGNNYGGTVVFSTPTVLPVGPTASVSPTSLSVTPSTSPTTTLTFSAGTAPAGSYSVTVTATDSTGSPAASTQVTFTIGATPVATLADAFGGTFVDSSKWTVSVFGSATVNEGGGTLNLVPPVSTGSSDAYVTSNTTYSLTGSTVFVHAPSVVSSGGNVDERFELLLDNSNLVEWYVQSGMLSAYYYVNGQATAVFSLTYSASAHAWWRIRETGGFVEWATSPDGMTWTTQATVADSKLFALITLSVRFYVETYGSGSPSPGQASFSNLNIVPSTPSLCALQDSFGGSVVNAATWDVSAIGGTITEGSGSLDMAPSANVGNTQLYVHSKANYSLIGCAAALAVPHVVSRTGFVDSEVSLRLDSLNYLQWFYQGGQLFAFSVVAGTRTQLASLAYNASAQAWWRIRESSGTVYWETSADGVTWQSQASALETSLFAVTSLQLTFFVETWGPGSGSPGAASFADLNTTPPAPSPPIATLVDAFNGSAVNTSLWSVRTAKATVGESGGTLNLSANANTGIGQILVTSKPTYRLLGSVVYVKAPAVVSQGGSIDEQFTILLDSGNYIQWFCQSGSLYAYYAVSGTRTSVASLTYSSTTDLWWRIREAGGTVYWDTSSNGVNWTSQGSVATSSLFSLDNVNLRFYVETFGGGSASPGIAKFANLND